MCVCVNLTSYLFVLCKSIEKSFVQFSENQIVGDSHGKAMTISKEKLSDLKDRYADSEKLIAEDSKHDPPTEPYRSHYAARDILHELTNKIGKSIEALEKNGPSDDVQRYQFILAHIKIDLGRIAMFVEEMTTAEQCLQAGIDLLTDNLHPGAVCAYLTGLNQLGILWTNRSDMAKAQLFLEKADETYKTFKEFAKSPLTIYDVFGTDDEIEIGKGATLLEKINTLTLFYLAQVYGGLGDLRKSAIYCHTTLKKQLAMKDSDAIEWALNAATLSQFFCTNKRYKEARHHLAAATQILDEYEQVMFKPEMTDNEKKAAEETFNHRSADVARCWVKYALNLMADSRDRLLDEQDTPSLSELNVSPPLTFGDAIDSAYESVVTDRFLLDMDDAKPVFLRLQKWIEKALTYYTAENEASEHSKVVQDHANAYKLLAFFESDPSNQAKMHKRRIDLLESLLELLNKVFYMNIVREALYELGTAYSNILDIKLDLMNQSNEPNPHSLKKINDLCTKTRSNFQEYIATYYVAKTETIKPDLDADELIPIAFAHFQVARIYYKYATPDRALQASHIANCMEYYRKFVEMSVKHKEVGDKLKAEVGVSKEMLQLLPLKLQKIRETSTHLPV